MPSAPSHVADLGEVAPLARRRKSSFIHGAEDDTRELSVYLARYLDRLCCGPVASVGAKSLQRVEGR